MEKFRSFRLGLARVPITVKAKEHELTVTETGKAERASGRVAGVVGAAVDKEEALRKHGDSKQVTESHRIVLLEHWSRQKHRRSPLRARSYQQRPQPRVGLTNDGGRSLSFRVAHLAALSAKCGVSSSQWASAQN